VLYLHSSFNIILTKAGFLHKDYLDIYSDTTQHPPEIHQHVKKVKNCEDIAMSFLIANRTRSEALKELSEIRRQANVYSYCSHCPVYVEGDVSDMGLFKGISTQSKGGWHKISGHMGERNKCIDVLAQIYKNHGWEYPLFDLPLVDHSWTHHFPGFWWQQHPSNFFEWLSFGNTFK
jgi:glucuronyl/N-acetylglucosaminyl transferase EXT2